MFGVKVHASPSRSGRLHGGSSMKQTEQATKLLGKRLLVFFMDWIKHHRSLQTLRRACAKLARKALPKKLWPQHELQRLFFSRQETTVTTASPHFAKTANRPEIQNLSQKNLRQNLSFIWTASQPLTCADNGPASAAVSGPWIPFLAPRQISCQSLPPCPDHPRSMASL